MLVFSNNKIQFNNIKYEFDQQEFACQQINVKYNYDISMI